MDKSEIQAILEGAKRALDLAHTRNTLLKTKESSESLVFWRYEVNHWSRLLHQASNPTQHGDNQGGTIDNSNNTH